MMEYDVHTALTPQHSEVSDIEPGEIIIIHNPFSGKRRGFNLSKLVLDHLDTTKYRPQIWPTKKAEDVITFARKAVERQAVMVVAAGGDGTINEISSVLKGTNVPMGMIPLGSGNGFARHLQIPLKPFEAIRLLNEAQCKMVDTFTVNGRHCINVAGIGFDAHISNLFAGKTKRGLKGYVKTIVKNLNYKSQEYHVTYDGGEWKGRAFMVCIANATQWGNNVKVYAGAKPDDGILNLVIIKQFNWLKLPALVYSLMRGDVKPGNNFEVFSGKTFVVNRTSEGPVHVDGEPFWSGSTVTVAVEPLTLKVISNE